VTEWVLSVLVVTGALVYLRAATNLERLQVGDVLGPQMLPTIVAVLVLMLCRSPLSWSRSRSVPSGNPPPRCAPRKAFRDSHCSVNKGEGRWHPASSTSP
jgi:hypothetical protein